MPSNRIPTAVAIAAVDPGRKTGVARGIFRPLTTIMESLSSAVELETWECEGPLESQADEIAAELYEWLGWCNIRGIAVPDCHMVVEDFQLRTQKADLSPVALTAKIESRWNVAHFPIERQQPAHAKGYATDDRLKNWGAWIPGSAHRRDALRHVLLRLSHVISGR